MIHIGDWRLGKECGGRWFPRVGHGRWDGFRSFLEEPIRLDCRRWSDRYSFGFSFGPLMLWKEYSK